MKKGENTIFTIPPELIYGETGLPVTTNNPTERDFSTPLSSFHGPASRISSRMMASSRWYLFKGKNGRTPRTLMKFSVRCCMIHLNWCRYSVFYYKLFLTCFAQLIHTVKYEATCSSRKISVVCIWPRETDHYYLHFPINQAAKYIYMW